MTAPLVTPAPPRSDRNERSFLIVACLLSAGALALPRLLRSKAFGPIGKLVLGTLAVLQTALCAAIVVFLVVRGPWLFERWIEYVQRHSRVGSFPR